MLDCPKVGEECERGRIRKGGGRKVINAPASVLRRVDSCKLLSPPPPPFLLFYSHVFMERRERKGGRETEM